VSELAFLSWLRGHLGHRGGPAARARLALRRAGRIVVDSGDDCAVVRIGRELVLFKTDTVIEDVHFKRGTPWRAVGRKAMARALSDIAAMGGLPTFAVAAAVLRRSMTLADAKAITRGLEVFGVPIVGGDLKSHDGPCSIVVSLLGEMRGAKPVLRRGAKPGDVLMVTGKLGNSIAGHHLSFSPRLREGRLFATRFRVNAMIDISDGLAIDLAHLGVGADLVHLPCRGTVEQALHDGEDYELLVAVSPAVAKRIERAKLAVAIGTVARRKGIRLKGARVALRGYEHRFGVP
jgi:thiamine-monophosphate kinase